MNKQEMSVQEMSVKKESDVYMKFLDLVSELSDKTGRSIDYARYTFFTAIEMGGKIWQNAYTYALQSLLFFESFGSVIGGKSK